MPRNKNSLKYELFSIVSKDVKNNRTRSSYKHSITRFAKWAKQNNIKNKKQITEEVIQQYQEDLKNDPRQYSAATIHTYLAPVCKSVNINMNRIRKDKRKSDKITRGRKKEKNEQGHQEENSSRFSRIVEFQRVVGIRRNELRKLKGSDLKRDSNGNIYVVVRRGKGGKYHEQLILPKDATIVVNTFQNINSNENVFSKVELNNHINFHKMRADHAKDCYYYYLNKINSDKDFKRRLQIDLINKWEIGHQNLAQESMKKYLKQKDHFICELSGESYKIRGSNYQKALKTNSPTIYNRLALMAVSVYNLSHWRLSVTVTNYLL